MQELIPINETEFAVYDYETKEYLPKILNVIEIQMLILEELQDYIISQHLNNRTNKIQITKT